MRPRFTIAGMLALVAVSGVSFAALRYADDLVADLAFTTTLNLLGIAALGAAFLRGRSRAFCTGLAAFGFASMALCFGPDTATEIRPHLATTKLLDSIGPHVNRPSQGDPYVLGYVEVAGAGRITTSGDGSSMVISGPKPASLTLVVSATPEFMRVGHSLAALAAAVLGGLVARSFAARGEREAAG